MRTVQASIKAVSALGWSDETYFRFRGWIPVPLYAATLLLCRFGVISTREMWPGLSLAVAGILLRCGGRMSLGRSSDTRRLHCRKLVTTGIYAWVRNPIYSGNMLIAMGIAVLAGAEMYSMVLGAALWLHYSRVVRAEERLLEHEFPEQYAAYRRSVPRFFPRGVPPEARETLARLGREVRILAGVALVVAVLIVARLV